MAPKQQTEPAEPTAVDQTKAQQVAVAGATAAANAENAEQAGQEVRQAMRDERDRVNLDMSDEDIDRIASAFTDKITSVFEQRGAFDSPPEPVQPPQQPQAPPPPGEDPQHPEPAPQQPQKRSWAAKFMGG